MPSSRSPCRRSRLLCASGIWRRAVRIPRPPSLLARSWRPSSASARGWRGRAGGTERYMLPRLRRILIIDDIEDSREMYAFYLEHSGWHVEVASDGEMGLQLALTAPFDVIVMDLAMPKMDGVEVTRRLKTDERTRQI